MVPPLLCYDSGDDPTRRKSMLFCWECDHTSPIEDDWIHRTRGEYAQVVCPHCDTVLGERPRAERVPAVRRRPAERLVAAWGRSLQASIELWCLPFDVGAASYCRTEVNDEGSPDGNGKFSQSSSPTASVARARGVRDL